MTIKFEYTYEVSDSAAVQPMPYLPIELRHKQNAVIVKGLLDSGATVNVLPFGIGLQLGLIWEQQSTQVMLTGNLSNFDARGVILTGEVLNEDKDARFNPRRLAFAWTQAKNVPLILG